MRLSLWPRSRIGQRRADSLHPWDLSAPLLHWAPGIPWTVRDSVEGLLCLGRTGSGKTTGTGRLVAYSMLRAGYAGLVLVAKRDEVELWRDLCRRTNRLDDLVVITPGGPWRFNPLSYELQRPGAGAGHCENIVNMFCTILELADRDSGQGGKQDGEAYWRQAFRQLVRNFTGLLLLATGSVTVNDLYRAVMSAASSLEEVASKAWQETSFCCRLLKLAQERAASPEQLHDLSLIADYILAELPNLSPRTRSVITSTFTSQIDVMQRGVLYQLFGRDTTVTPESIEQGKVVVVGLPVKEYGQVGIIANALMKYAFQRSIERRDVTRSPRPVFLYADEAQHFVTSYDQMFQTTCHSAKVATVLLSQNISNFYAALGGGDKGRAETDSLVGNLNTKLFHANGDAVTNEWAATQIGRTRKLFMNSSSSSPANDWFETISGQGQQGQTSAGMSEQMAFEVEPSEFTTLRTGGPANRGLIDAIMYQSGRRFASTGRTWTPVMFKQDL